MIDALEAQYKPDKAEAFKSRYFAAKTKLFTDILPWIRANEQYLSDHSERHIENVLDNIYKLICSDIEESINRLKSNDFNQSKVFTGTDLYFLCQVALFHDVGNFYGRNKHNQKISEVINKAFGDLFGGENRRERKLIAEAGRVHTGKSMNGSDDSLMDLFNKSEHIQGDHIHFCSIASIVRFADELAEGPQRTSSFMQDEGMIPEENSIFHKYASCTHIKIDSPNQRISISYEINFDVGEGTNTDEIEREIRLLLELIYSRINKLDQERKYYNYYNRLSKPIRETQVVFNFQKNDFDLSIKPDPLILNDLVVPGGRDQNISFTDERQDLDISHLVKSISDQIFQVGDE